MNAVISLKISFEQFGELYEAMRTNSGAGIKRLVRGGLDPKLYLHSENCHLLHFAVRHEADQVLRELVLAGAGIDSLSCLLATGTTGSPISEAASLGWVEGIQTLASLGADIGLEDQLGGTPLYHAIQFQHVAAVKALLELGVSPATRCGVGEKTALDAAIKVSKRTGTVTSQSILEMLMRPAPTGSRAV